MPGSARARWSTLRSLGLVDPARRPDGGGITPGHDWPSAPIRNWDAATSADLGRKPQSRTELSAMGSDRQTVLILTPVKNATGFLDTYFAGLDKLTYPASSISLGFLESDSDDGTFERIRERLGPLRLPLCQCRDLAEELRFPHSARASPDGPTLSRSRGERSWRRRETSCCFARSRTRIGCCGSTST